MSCSRARLSRGSLSTLGVASILCCGIFLSSSQVVAEDFKWAGCGITKKAFMAELAAAFEKKTGAEIVLEGGGATRGIRDTAAGKTHIGGACRLPLTNPLGSLTDKRERRVKTIPVAWDALVVIVHPENPVKSVSLQQVRALYSGEVDNWRELGGADAPIELLIRRGKTSGVGRTLRELVFGDSSFDFPRMATVFKSSGPLEKAIMKNPNAIGMTGVSSARRRNVKMLELANVSPTYDNIKSGRYLLYRPLYLVVPRRKAEPRIKDFVRFALSREGREIMRKQGTVPFTDAPNLLLKRWDETLQAGSGGVSE